MNEQLQKELTAWLGKLREAADMGGSFVLEQAPLIAQEAVTYGRVYHTAGLVLGVLVALLACVVVRRAMRTEEDGDMLVATVIGVISLIGAPILVFENAHDAMLAWFAPRLYVIEWMAGFLK